MNGRPDVERLVTDWLMATAPARAPHRVLDAALERVADVGQEHFIGVPLGGRGGRSSWLRWAILAAVLASALLGAIAGAGTFLRREAAVIQPPQPVDLTWTLERAAQDWPGPLRAEPEVGGPIVRSDGRVAFGDQRGDTVPAPLAVVDIVEVVTREGCWMSLTTEGCFFYDLASPLTQLQLDPRRGWFAYGIVVDNTGDGRPDLRFGIDNAAGDGGARMWLTELATGTTRAFEFLEDPNVMDAHLGVVEAPTGHIFVRRPGPTFRFYVWASAIVDGQIVATDYAPDFGWIEFR